MKTIRKFATACAVLMATVGAVAWGQTFNVVSQVTEVDYFSTLDSTYVITYNVTLTSPSTLTNVIPTLSVPPCANAQGRRVFETTYRGQPGGSTTDLAVFSWSNGQTKQLTFYVHVYNESIMCDNVVTACGGSTFDFDLSFTHNGSATPIAAVDNNNALRFDSVPPDSLTIVDIYAYSAASQCGRYFSPTWLIQLTAFQPPLDGNGNVLLEPNQRILLGCNWRLGTEPNPNIGQSLGLFDVPINTSERIPLTDLLLAEEDPLQVMPESTFITDSTGVILGTPSARFPISPLGGEVPDSGTLLDCAFEGWNFFDVTDVEVNGAPVKDKLAPFGGNNKIQGITSRDITYWRDGGLFIAEPGGCSTAQAFYQAPSNFEFTGMHFNDDGTVDVTVSVPVAWTTGVASTLHSDYSIQWFYKNHNTFKAATAVGSSPSRNLNQTLTFPYSSPSQFQLEARIRHLPSNSYVSVDSPRHALTYAGLDSGSYIGAEQPTPDEFLDPGETYRVSAVLGNSRTTAVNNFSIVLGPTGGATVGVRGVPAAKMGGPMVNGPGVAYSGSLAGSAVNAIDLEFQLIEAEQICEETELEMIFQYTEGNFSTSYTQLFTLPTDCEFLQQVVGFGDSGWVAKDLFGSPNPCQDSNCGNSTPSEIQTGDGWSFSNGVWSGEASLGLYFTLTSPQIATPRDPRLHMRHTVGLTFVIAGGIVEYREYFPGTGWGSWQDAITPIETTENIDLYNPRQLTVDPNLDQMISNRGIFMEQTITQDWTYDFPVAFTGDLVQFRLLFQKASPGTGSSGTWEVEAFDFMGDLPNPDNVFGVNNGAYSSCLSQIDLTLTTPGTYSYEFYPGLDALMSGVPDHVSANGTWPNFPQPTENTTYYARIIETVDNTERIVGFLVEASNNGVPLFGTVVDNWRNPVPVETDTDIDNDGVTTVLDLILQIELDTCNQ